MFIEILFSLLNIPTIRDQTKKKKKSFFFCTLAHYECIRGMNLKKKKKKGKQSILQSFRSTSLTSSVICHFHCRRVLTSAPCAEMRVSFLFFTLIPCSLPSLPRAFSVCPSDLRIHRGERLGCAGFILSNIDKDEPLLSKLEDQIMRALPTEQTTECISFHRVHQNLNTLGFNICNPTTGCLCLCSIMEKCQFAPSITTKYLQRPAFCCHGLFNMATADSFLFFSLLLLDHQFIQAQQVFSTSPQIRQKS